jgi:hypothetical protein
MLHSLGQVQVIAQKTRLVCVARVRFAGLSPRKRGFQASFALHRWLEGPRIVRKVDYGPRWRGHYVLVRSRADLDDELRGWLQEAHDVVGLQTGLADRAGAGHPPAQALEGHCCIWRSLPSTPSTRALNALGDAQD